ERLDACRPDLLEGRAGERTCQAQVVGKGQVCVHRTIIPRAAVNTLVVAVVRYRNPEIGHRATVFVDQGSHAKYPMADSREEESDTAGKTWRMSPFQVLLAKHGRHKRFHLHPRAAA